MSRLIFVLSSILLLSPASSHAINYTKYERGSFWCNEQKWGIDTFDSKHLKVAKRGYLYTLAAALALQKENQESKDHFFASPKRMKEADRPDRKDSGFEVVTYEIYSDEDRVTLQEVVIAFLGSNDSEDWIKTNLAFDKRQYIDAVDYVINTSLNPKYKDIRIVVSGFSLGGALAIHAAKNPISSKLIDEVWALNPSPRTYANDELDDRIWVAAVRGEFLSKFRSKYFRTIPGSSNIGALPEHKATDYYLVKANPGFSHFRYVLMRNILFSADIAMNLDVDSERKNEPLGILKESIFSSCKSD